MTSSSQAFNSNISYQSNAHNQKNPLCAALGKRADRREQVSVVAESALYFLGERATYLDNGEFVEIDSILISEEEISEFSLLRTVNANELKSKFEQIIADCKDVEENNSTMWIIKTLANFMGGGLITGGGRHKRLDGFLPEINYGIWQWIFNWINSEIEDQSSSEVKILHNIRIGIDKLYEQCKTLNLLVKNSKNSKELVERIYLHAFETMGKIQALAPGKAEIFDCGWSNIAGGSGHALIYEIQRREDGKFDLLLFTSTHFALSETILIGSKIHLKPVIRYEAVPEDVLFFGSKERASPIFIQALMEITVLAQKNINMKVDGEDVLAVFDYLSSYRRTVLLAEGGVTSGQIGGTCVPSVTKQMLRWHAHNLSFHKQLMFHVKFKLLLAGYCALENVLSSPEIEGEFARRALKLESKKLLKKLAKLTKENVLSPELIQQVRASIHDILLRISVFEVAIEKERKASSALADWQKINSVEQRKRRQELEFTPAIALKEGAPVKILRPNLSIQLSLTENPVQSLLKALQQTLQICKELKCHQAFQIHHLIDQIPVPDVGGNAYWDAFSPEELQKVQSQLFEVTTVYTKNYKLDLISRRYATVLPLQALIHFLAVQIDSHKAKHRNHNPKAELRNYKTPSFVSALELEELQFFDRQQFQRLQHASHYFNQHNKQASQDILFEDDSIICEIQKDEVIRVENSEKIDLINGFYWHALLNSDSALKEAVTEYVNAVFYPDLTEEVIEANYNEMERKFQESPRTEPHPQRQVNLPLATKQTLFLEAVTETPKKKGEVTRVDFLADQGYAFIDVFRHMNILAGGFMYALYPDFQFVRISNRNSFQLTGEIVSWTNGGRRRELKEVQDLLMEALPRDNKRLSIRHRNLLSKTAVSFRDVSKWSKKIAEGLNLKISPAYKRFTRPLSQWKIAPQQLLYELEKELNSFDNPLEDYSFHAFFFRLFFRSPLEGGSLKLGVGDLIVENRALLEKAKAVIDKGIHEIQAKDRPFVMARFFFEMSFHLAKFLADTDRFEDAAQFDLSRYIRLYLEGKDKLSPLDESALYFYHFLFCSLKKELTEKELAQALALWVMYNRQADLTNESKSPILERMASAFAIRLVEEASRAEKEPEYAAQLGAQIAAHSNNYGRLFTIHPNSEWKVDSELGFPYLTDGSTKINLLSGQVYLEEGLLKGMPSGFPWEKSVDFIRLFGHSCSFRYESLGNGIILFTHPEKGIFRLIFTHPEKGIFRLIREELEYVIQRKLPGHDCWFQYERPTEFFFKRFWGALAFDHAFWFPLHENKSISLAVDKAEIKALITDLEHLKILYCVATDGKIHEAEALSGEIKADGYTLDFLSDDCYDAFEKFDWLENILVYSKGNTIHQLVFSRYCALDDNLLVFEQREGRLLWNGNRNYAIPNSMKKGILGTIKNYLYLESIKDPNDAKLLVPIQKIIGDAGPVAYGKLSILNRTPFVHGNERASTQRYLVLDCIHGEVIATNVEERCFLAYIYLSQKKYEEAINLLRSIKLIEDFSSTAMQLLRYIQELNVGEDHPNGKMVQLHALSLEIKQIEKKALEPIKGYYAQENGERIQGVKLSESLERLAKQIVLFSSVLQNIHNVSASCAFTLADECQLLSFLIEESQLKKFEQKREQIQGSLLQLNQRLFFLQKNISTPSFLSNGNTQRMLKKFPYISCRSSRLWSLRMIPKNLRNHFFFEEYPPIKSQVKTKEQLEKYKKEKGEYKENLIKKTAWLTEAFERFDPDEKLDYSAIECEDHFFENNEKLFLAVYHVAKDEKQLKVKKNELMFRLNLWRRRSSSEELACLLMILENPSNFPDLVKKGSSPLEKSNFLKKVESAYLAYGLTKKSYEANFEGEKERPSKNALPIEAASTNYPLPKVEPIVVQSLASIAENKISLKLVFDPQEARWNTFQHWKEFLVENKIPREAIGADFEFEYHEVEWQNAENYEELLKKDLEVLRSDYTEGKKQNLEALAKELSLEDCAVLGTEAKEKRQEVVKERKQLEAKLLSKVNVSSAIELARLAGNGAKIMTFQDCIDCLLSGDQRSYKVKNHNLTEDDILELGQLTLQILDLKSYEAQLTRVEDLTKQIQKTGGPSKKSALYSSLCQRLEVELSARYYFDTGYGVEEQIAFRVFAGQSGLIPFKKQIHLIRKMLKTDPTDLAEQKRYRDIVIQLIMGGGKTSVIATLILFLASKRQGRIGLFIVPPALFESVKMNLSESLLKAFGINLQEIKAEREAFTIYNLKKIYNGLLQAEESQSPIIVSATTIQGMELELLSLSRHLKEEIRNRDALTVEIEEIGEIKSDKLKNLQSSKNTVIQSIEKLQVKCKSLDAILTLTETKSDSLIDEIDYILDFLRELTYVDGKKVGINFESNQLLLALYQVLISDLRVSTMPGEPIISEVVGLKCNKQHLLKKETYLSHILPVLAEHLLKTFKPIALALPSIHKESFVRYVSESIPSELSTYLDQKNILTESLVKKYFPNHSADALKADLSFLKYLESLANSQFQKSKQTADLLALAKYFLVALIPSCLAAEGGRDYGLTSHANQAGKIIPYLAADTPATTEFGDHWQNAAYLYQWSAAFQPNEESILNIAGALKAAANYYIEEYGESLEENAEYRTFAKLFGVPLESINEKGMLKKAVENITKNPKQCLKMQSDLVKTHVNFVSERLTSNGFALGHLLGSRLTMSGTPWNAPGFTASLARRIKYDHGTEGRIWHTLAERASADKIIEIQEPKIFQEWLESVLSSYVDKKEFKKVRGIIDAGGTFKTFGNNSGIAKEWLEFIGNRQEQEKDLEDKTVDPAIEAVLFFGADPGQIEQNTLYVWRKGASKPDRIGGTSPKKLAAKGLNPNNYVILIDEIHGTGVDIAQEADAVNLMTYGHMLMRTTAQNVMRLRLFFSGQDVRFVVDAKTRISLFNQGKTVQDFIMNAAIQQSMSRTDSMEGYFMQQIHDAFRWPAIKRLRALIQKDQFGNEEFARCVETSEPFFVTSIQEKPFLQHGGLRQFVDTKLMLKASLKNKLKHYKSLIDDWTISIIEKGTTDLSEWIEETPYLAPKTLKKSGQIGLQQEIQQQIQQEQQVQVEVQVEIEQEVEMHLNQYLEGDFHEINPEVKMSLEEWDALILAIRNPKNSERIILLKDQLRKYDYQYQDQKYPFDKCFNEPIYGTENYFYTCKKGNGEPALFSVFHEMQRPPSQILAVKHEGQMCWLLLSEHEAKDAAKFLTELYQREAESEIWLIQPDGSLFVKGENDSTPFPLNEEETRKGLLEINAFGGNVDFINKSSHARIASEWLSDDLLLKVCFLKLRTFDQVVQKRHLMVSVPIAKELGNQNSEALPSSSHSMCKLRRKVEEAREGKFEAKTPIEAKLLTQKVGSLVKNQVQFLGIDISAEDEITREAVEWLIKNKNLQAGEELIKVAEEITTKQFNALAPFQVQGVNQDQLRWLPNKMIKFLKDPEFIVKVLQAEDGSNRMEYLLSADQVAGLTENQRDFIPFVNPAYYRQLNQNWQIMAVPQDKLHWIDPSQAVHLSPQQVKGITSEQLANPAFSSLLQNLSSEQFEWIDGNHLAFLAPEFYHKITQKQIQEIKDETLICKLEDLWEKSAGRAKPGLWTSWVSVSQIKCLSLSQVPYLKTKEQVVALPDLLLHEISQEQVKFLDPRQVSLLNSEILIQACTPELDLTRYLKDSQLSKISTEQVKALDDNQLLSCSRNSKWEEFKEFVTKEQIERCKLQELIECYSLTLIKQHLLEVQVPLLQTVETIKACPDQFKNKLSVGQINQIQESKSISDETKIEYINSFGSKGFNSLENSHPLWSRITPEAIANLNSDKIVNVAKEKLCHVAPGNRKALQSIKSHDYIHLKKGQLASLKSSLWTYCLGVMTLGVIACAVSLVAFTLFPIIWVVNREASWKYKAALTLPFKKLEHLFTECVPALLAE